MTPHKPHSPRRFKKSLLLLCFVCAAVVIFHKPLVLLGCKVALQKMIPSREGETVSYEKMQWENGSIVLSGLLIRDQDLEVTIDRIELKLSGDVFRLRFAPEIIISHPQILLSSYTSTETSPFPFLYRTQFFQPRWTVKNGVLQLPPSSRFYFGMAPGWENESIGSLTVSHDPDPLVMPFFAAKMAMRDQTLEVGFKLQESDLQTLPPLLALLFAGIPKEWERALGEVDVEGVVSLGKVLDIEEFHIQATGKEIALSGSEMGLLCEEVEGSFAFSATETEGLFWDRLSASLRVKNGECLWGKSNCGVKDLNGEIALQPQQEPQLALSGTCIQGSQEVAFTLSGQGGVLQTPSFHGQWGALEAEIAILGFQADPMAEVTVHGDARELLSLLGMPLIQLPVSLQVAVKMEGNSVLLEGEGSISGEPIEGYAAFDVSSDLFPTVRLKEGVLSAHLTPKSYAEFIPLMLPETALFGDLQCEALFSSSSIQLKIAGEKVHFVHPLAELQVAQMKGGAAQFSYDVASQQWRGQIPMADAQLYCQSLDLAFEHIEGDVQWANGCLKAPSFYAECKGMAWRGGWELDKDHCFRLEKGESVWELLDGTPLTVQIERLSAQLSGDSAVDFDLKIVDRNKEFAHFEGKATPSSSAGWDLAFDADATHFDGILLHITRCTFHRKTGVTSFEMHPTLTCQRLTEQAAFLQNAALLPLTFSAESLKQWQLEGAMQMQLSSEDMAKGFSFHAESGDLKIKGQSCTPFHVHGHKRGQEWFIEKLEVGGLFLKGDFLAADEGISFPRFEGAWKGISMRGSGHVKAENGYVFGALDSLDGELVQSLLSLRASSRGPIAFTYDPEEGLVCSGIDFQIKHKLTGAHLAKFQAATLLRSSLGEFSIDQIQFSGVPMLLTYAIDAKIIPTSFRALQWEGNFEGSGDVLTTNAKTVFQGNLKPGRYGFDGKSAPFEQLQLRYEKNLLSIRAKARIEQQPLWGAFQVDLSQEPFGMLKLFDHPKAEGLKILFTTHNAHVTWESIQGSCYGLTCSLHKSARRKLPFATVLAGEVAVDGSALWQLFPKEIRKGIETLQFGSGYQWKGDLVLWQDMKKGFLAHGALLGREFEALGYRFRTMQSKIEANPTHVILSDLKLDDPAGSVAIKKIELKKREGWDLAIPHIQVHKLQPSVMRKVEGEQTEEKPFLIQNLIFTHIRGRLGDQSSLQGSGHLMFVNQFRKESSILDGPLEMIKNIGIDFNLLTPVQGELQMELHGDKFYLISLDNSFSEGGRSEFYLPPEKGLSYIDLDGKVHIDLKMRQDVLLKITEPFTLTIRGTLDKPRYGLHF